MFSDKKQAEEGRTLASGWVAGPLGQVVIPQACADHGHPVIKSTELVAQQLMHRPIALHSA
jgi:hypothetical protein